MLPVMMDRSVSVWRRAALNDGSGSLGDTKIYSNVLAGIVPVSRLDQNQPYAYESTHIIWLPYWLVLRKEDQIRYGAQAPDPQGDIAQLIYTINGRRGFSLGMPDVAYYARELE